MRWGRVKKFPFFFFFSHFFRIEGSSGRPWEEAVGGSEAKARGGPHCGGCTGHKMAEAMERDEVEEFTTGPLSVLTTSVKTNSQVSDPFSVAAL